MSATYFKTGPHITPLDPVCISIFAALNGGLSGLGSVSVSSSKRGLRIALNGKTLANGKTPQELHEAFQSAAAAAQQKSAN